MLIDKGIIEIYKDYKEEIEFIFYDSPDTDNYTVEDHYLDNQDYYLELLESGYDVNVNRYF